MKSSLQKKSPISIFTRLSVCLLVSGCGASISDLKVEGGEKPVLRWVGDDVVGIDVYDKNCYDNISENGDGEEECLMWSVFTCNWDLNQEFKLISPPVTYGENPGLPEDSRANWDEREGDDCSEPSRWYMKDAKELVSGVPYIVEVSARAVGTAATRGILEVEYMF